MNLDPGLYKLHPQVLALRDELSFQPRPNCSGDDHWFCLKPDRLAEYVQKQRLFPAAGAEPPAELPAPSAEFIRKASFLARKSGVVYNPREEARGAMRGLRKTAEAGNGAASPLRRKENAGEARVPAVAKKIRKPGAGAGGRRFVIEIDD